MKSDKPDRVYEAIREHWQHRGIGPTYGDLMAATGISSTAVVDYSLKALERQGRIVMGRDGRSRSIRLVLQPGDACPCCGQILGGVPVFRIEP